MGYTTIGGYINSFFKQAKASIALVFSTKLQDIFARGRQGAWSAHPKSQRRQVLQVLPKHSICTCLDRVIDSIVHRTLYYRIYNRVMVCYLVERFLKSAHPIITRGNVVFTFHYLALHITPDRES